MINFFLSSFLIIIIIILHFFQVSKFHGGKRDKRYVSNFYESRISISAIVLINHKGFHVYKLNPVILNKILLQQSKMYDVYSIGFWWGRIIGNRNINIFVLFLPSSFFKYLIASSNDDSIFIRDPLFLGSIPPAKKEQRKPPIDRHPLQRNKAEEVEERNQEPDTINYYKTVRPFLPKTAHTSSRCDRDILGTPAFSLLL